MRRLCLLVFCAVVMLVQGAYAHGSGLTTDFLGFALGQSSDQIVKGLFQRGINHVPTYELKSPGEKIYVIKRKNNHTESVWKTVKLPSAQAPRLRKLGGSNLVKFDNGKEDAATFVFWDNVLIQMSFSVPVALWRGMVDEFSTKYSSFIESKSGKGNYNFFDGNVRVVIESMGPYGGTILFYNRQAVQSIIDMHKEETKNKKDSLYDSGKKLVR